MKTKKPAYAKSDKTVKLVENYVHEIYVIMRCGAMTSTALFECL